MLDVGRQPGDVAHDEHRSVLICFAEHLDDCGPRPREANVFQVDLFSKPWIKRQHPFELSAVGTVVALIAAVLEVGFEQEELITHGDVSDRKLPLSIS